MLPEVLGTQVSALKKASSEGYWMRLSGFYRAMGARIAATTACAPTVTNGCTRGLTGSSFGMALRGSSKKTGRVAQTCFSLDVGGESQRGRAAPLCGRNQSNENEDPPLVDGLCVETLCLRGPGEMLRKMFARKTRNYGLAMQRLVFQRLCGFSLKFVPVYRPAAVHHRWPECDSA